MQRGKRALLRACVVYAVHMHSFRWPATWCACLFCLHISVVLLFILFFRFVCARSCLALLPPPCRLICLGTVEGFFETRRLEPDLFLCKNKKKSGISFRVFLQGSLIKSMVFCGEKVHFGENRCGSKITFYRNLIKVLQKSVEQKTNRYSKEPCRSHAVDHWQSERETESH